MDACHPSFSCSFCLMFCDWQIYPAWVTCHTSSYWMLPTTISLIFLDSSRQKISRWFNSVQSIVIIMWRSVFPCIAEWRITSSCLIDYSLLMLDVFYLFYLQKIQKKVISRSQNFQNFLFVISCFLYDHLSYNVIFFFSGGEFFTQPDCSNEGSFCIFFFVQTDSWLYPFECCKGWHNVRNSFYFSNVFPSKKHYSKWK